MLSSSTDFGACLHGLPVSRFAGVSIGDLNDRTYLEVWTTREPTRDEQQAAGEALLSKSYDPDSRTTAFLEEQADKAFTAYLALPETQAFLKVHTDLKEAVFLDEIDSDPDFDPRGEVEDHLEIAYKKAYKDTHSRP
jgi:hypothetical protein